jgi:hypothetical protein
VLAIGDRDQRPQRHHQPGAKQQIRATPADAINEKHQANRHERDRRGAAELHDAARQAEPAIEPRGKRVGGEQTHQAGADEPQSEACYE